MAIIYLFGLEQHAGTKQLGTSWPSDDGNPVPRLQEIEVRRLNKLRGVWKVLLQTVLSAQKDKD